MSETQQGWPAAVYNGKANQDSAASSAQATGGAASSISDLLKSPSNMFVSKTERARVYDNDTTGNTSFTFSKPPKKHIVNY